MILGDFCEMYWLELRLLHHFTTELQVPAEPQQETSAGMEEVPVNQDRALRDSDLLPRCEVLQHPFGAQKAELRT